MPGTITISDRPIIRSKDVSSSTSTNLKASLADISRLPNISECTAHLELLEGFVLLRLQVEKWGESLLMDGSEAWYIFVRLAAGRFVTWIKDGSEGTPSLEVLMVWHAFMLNPRAYLQFERTVLKERKLGRGLDWVCLPNMLGSKKSATNNNLIASLQKEVFTKEDLLQRIPAQAPLSSFDLVAAVHCQMKFANTMSSYNWLHSPYLHDTMSRSITRYEKFFALIAANPGKMLSPTIDIDLVWHTHQLSPASYRTYSREITGGRFVNHDDTIGEEVLVPSRDSAQSLFYAEFGEEYDVCLCWDCEGLRSSQVHDDAGIETMRREVSDALEREKTRREESLLPPMIEMHCGRYSKNAVGCGSGCGSGCGGGCGAAALQNTTATSGCANCGSGCGSGCGGSAISGRANQIAGCGSGCGSGCGGGCGANLE